MHKPLVQIFLCFFQVNCDNTLTQRKVIKDCSTVQLINGNIKTISYACLLAERFKLQMIINQGNHFFWNFKKVAVISLKNVSIFYTIHLELL